MAMAEELARYEEHPQVATLRSMLAEQLYCNRQQRTTMERLEQVIAEQRYTIEVLIEAVEKAELRSVVR